jgi:hypothetical protein
MNTKRCAILVAALAASGTLEILSSSATEADRCEELVKECFAAARDQRESCLHTMSTRPQCVTSETGTLLAKRLQFSGVKPSDADLGPAFLGPQIINRRCVESFDTSWSAALVREDVSTKTLEALSATLDQCATHEDNPLPRP